MKKGIIYTVLFSVIISFLFVLGLTAVNETTKPLTERNARLALRKGMLTAFGIPYSGDAEAFSLFDDKIIQKSVQGDTLYIYNENGSDYYGIRISGKGLWNTITCALAVDQTVSRIKGVAVINQSETPGLGGRIEETAYTDQFRNEAIGPDMKIKSVQQGAYDTDHENGQVDGITGATGTSTSMVVIVNDGIMLLKKYLGESNEQQ
ncbi:MAG: FMN-binding protein [Spirochaetales bacterium]|nr:FMN-binding protein [Spirochaetales bacterium]